MIWVVSVQGSFGFSGVFGMQAIVSGEVGRLDVWGGSGQCSLFSGK